MATTGARDDRVAHIEVLGVNGSCTCTTSGANRSSTARTRRRDHGRGSIGAFEALYGMSTGRPTGTHPRFVGAIADGRQHDHVVAAVGEPRRQLAHVHLDAARVVPGVRADEGDPHGSHAGWNMCQSDGAAAIARSKPAAISSVSATTSSRRFPEGSIAHGGYITHFHPSSV